MLLQRTLQRKATIIRTAFWRIISNFEQRHQSGCWCVGVETGVYQNWTFLNGGRHPFELQMDDHFASKLDHQQALRDAPQSLKFLPAWKLEHPHSVVMKHCFPVLSRNGFLVSFDVGLHRG